jgi:hypothetical protein
MSPIRFGLVIIAILIIIVVALPFVYGWVPALPPLISKAERLAAASSSAAPLGGPLNCRDQSAIAEAKKYYDNSDERGGVFTMDPISSVQQSSRSCMIKYRPAKLTDVKPQTVIQQREFTYIPSSSGWKAVAMGDLHSGILQNEGSK